MKCVYIYIYIYISFHDCLDFKTECHVYATSLASYVN